MVKIRRPKTAPPRRKSNTFETLTPPSSNKTDISDNEEDAILLPCGTKNSDGTVFGGGPLNVHCSKCKQANYPTEYGHGHRSNQRQFCPVLQKITTAETAEEQLSPDLKSLADEHVPLQRTAAKATTETQNKMGVSKTPPSPKGVLGKSQQWPAPPPPMH